MDVQLVFSWAPKIARKLARVNIGFPVVRTNGRLFGVRSRDNQIFWDGKIFLAMGLRPRPALRAAWSSANTYCWAKVNYILIDVFTQLQGLSVRRVPSTQDCYVFKLDPSLPTPQKLKLDMEQVSFHCNEGNVSVRLIIPIFKGIQVCHTQYCLENPQKIKYALIYVMFNKRAGGFSRVY